MSPWQPMCAVRKKGSLVEAAGHRPRCWRRTCQVPALEKLRVHLERLTWEQRASLFQLHLFRRQTERAVQDPGRASAKDIWEDAEGVPRGEDSAG